MPGTRTRFRPSPTASSSAARSPGVHTAPRQNTWTPLTQRSREPSPDRFSMVRNPTRPTTSPSTTTSWSRGVPWVCGHHSSTSVNSMRCSRPTSTTPVVPSSQAPASVHPRSGDQRDRPVRPDHWRSRREPRCTAEELGADPPQLRLLHQHGPPTLPGLGRQRLEQLGQRVHHDADLMVSGRDRHLVPLEHGPAGPDHLAVHQQVPDRGDAADLRTPGGRPPTRGNSCPTESASGPGSGVSRSNSRTCRMEVRKPSPTLHPRLTRRYSV